MARPSPSPPASHQPNQGFGRLPTQRWAPASRDVLRVAGVVIAVYLSLRLLWVGRSVFLLTFLAVLFGLCLSKGVDYLAGWKIPRALGAALIVVAVLAGFTGLGAIVAPRIGQQVNELRRQLPDAIQEVEQWINSRYRGLIETIQQPQPEPPPRQAPAAPRETQGGGGQDRGEPQAATTIRRGLAEQMAGLGSSFFAVFSSTLSVLAGLILIVFVAIYVAVDPGQYHRGIMHLFPHGSRQRAGEVLSEVATLLRRWLLTQLIAMLVIGSVTTVVLLLIGVHAPIALGILAGLLEFVPYVGPIVSAVPAIAMGFLSGPQMALAVALAYVCIQQAENHLLIPLLMKRELDLPPVVTIVSQAIMGLIFGFLGLLVAVPLMGAATVLVKMLYVQDVVGDEVPLSGET